MVVLISLSNLLIEERIRRLLKRNGFEVYDKMNTNEIIKMIQNKDASYIITDDKKVDFYLELSERIDEDLLSKIFSLTNTSVFDTEVPKHQQIKRLQNPFMNYEVLLLLK